MNALVERIQALGRQIADMPETNGTVILTFCNWSFRDLTLNLLATLARVNRVRAARVGERVAFAFTL